jgi:preprotein translocase subunit SecA
MNFRHADASAMSDEEAPPAGEEHGEQQPFVRSGRKVGRNEPCPCGSGKKYKQCHGRLA